MSITVIVVVFIVLISFLLVATIILSSAHNHKGQVFAPSGKLLWADRKHTFLGLPLSFTRYSFDKERFFIQEGLFTTVENEVRLYRILDLQLRQNLIQKILGLGSISLKTTDKSMHHFVVENIAFPRKVKEMLSELVEEQRKQSRIMGREIFGDDEGTDN